MSHSHSGLLSSFTSCNSSLTVVCLGLSTLQLEGPKSGDMLSLDDVVTVLGVYEVRLMKLCPVLIQVPNAFSS